MLWKWPEQFVVGKFTYPDSGPWPNKKFIEESFSPTRFFSNLFFFLLF